VLVAAGEVDGAAASPDYTALGSQLDEAVVSALYRLQPSYQTATTGESTGEYPIEDFTIIL
jgi:hypothetical protein